MNGIDKIKERILADCEAEVGAIKASSDAECARIREKYTAEAEREYERLRAEGEAEAVRRRKYLSGAAELEARKQLLAVKQELISAAFALAEERLAALPEKEYIAFAARLAANASRTGEEQILLNGRDRDNFGAQITAAANELLKNAGRRGELTLSGDKADIKGGVILRDGRIESNCSVETLVAGRRAELAAEVLKLLF